jgi:general secretion pathway protein G
MKTRGFIMKKHAGFTILEVIIIVVLISIIAGIVIPRISVSNQKARVQSCEMNRSIINKQVEIYYFVEATWPMDTLDDVKTNASYFPDGIPSCPVNSTSYTLATSPYHRVSGHREGAIDHIF